LATPTTIIVIVVLLYCAAKLGVVPTLLGNSEDTIERVLSLAWWRAGPNVFAIFHSPNLDFNPV
jgi:hypothetical protein